MYMLPLNIDEKKYTNFIHFVYLKEGMIQTFSVQQFFNLKFALDLLRICNFSFAMEYFYNMIDYSFS